MTNYILNENLKECKDNKCIICLGILQNVDKKSHIENTCMQITQEDFEFDSFKFTIKIPLSTGLRYVNVNKWLFF